MEQASKDSKLILIAEDDPTLARFLRRHLETEGLHPHIVETGEETLRLASTIHPHVIVLDVGLPDTDGITVCKTLKQNPYTAEIPVLFLTSRSDIEDRVIGLDAGAQDYLVKPFDMTEFQARIRAILRKEEESDKVRDLFEQRQEEYRAIIGHEIRAPLTIINMATHLLSENKQLSEERQNQLVQTIRGGASTLTHIVNDFDYISNPSRHLRTCNLRAIILEIVGDARDLAQESGVHLLPRVPEDFPPLVADETYLRRSLAHLVDNAIKFTSRGDAITITAALSHQGHVDQGANGQTFVPEIVPLDQSPWVVISVRDTGIGIAPEHQRRIFEPFYQVDSSTTRTAQGMGLGLAVVAAFVRSHHGHLAVSSGVNSGVGNNANSGTVIQMALPLHPPTGELQQPAPFPPEGPESA